MGLDNPNKYINQLRTKFPGVHQQLVTDGVHPAHIAYKLINLDAQENGTYWSKCIDCGQPYIVADSPGDKNFCSAECAALTAEYLNIPINYTPPNPHPKESKDPRF